MTERELELLEARLRACRRYLEFGSGNSTRLAASMEHIEAIDSVESSREFVDENLRCDPALTAAEQAGRLRIHTVDIGASKAWGTPVGKAKRHLWPCYPLAVFAEHRQWDLVLVDGRFRVACGLAALLHLPPGGQLLVHDFWHRVQYYPLLAFVDVVERVDSFALFTPKARLNRRRAQALIRKYQYLPKDVTPLQQLMKPINRKLRGVSRQPRRDES